jgi:formate hydrogenlyase subunit 3/multisubunit Na+/H+ antiporter MnhD subunit
MKRFVSVVFSIIVLCGLLLMPAALVTASYEGHQTTSPDVLGNWESETGTIETVPEPLTIAAVILLSCVAVAVSFYFLRKRPETESHSTRKSGETPKA